MVNLLSQSTSMQPAGDLIGRFGEARLARACGKHPSIIRRWGYPHEKGGQGGLINARAQIAIIELAIAEGEPLELAELFPSDLVARLQASNDRISASEEEAA